MSPIILIIILLILFGGGGTWGWQHGYYGGNHLGSGIGLLLLVLLVLWALGII